MFNLQFTLPCRYHHNVQHDAHNCCSARHCARPVADPTAPPQATNRTLLLPCFTQSESPRIQPPHLFADRSSLTKRRACGSAAPSAAPPSWCSPQPRRHRLARLGQDTSSRASSIAPWQQQQQQQQECMPDLLHLYATTCKATGKIDG
jgi:hypothetical protein